MSETKAGKRRFEREFLAAFQKPLATVGFQYAGHLYFNREGDRQGIQFAETYRYLAKRFEFMMYAGVTHPAVNDLCGHEVMREDNFTVGIGIYCRTRDETFGYWYLEDPTSIPEVLEYVHREAIPFVERFSDLNEIRLALEAGPPLPFICAHDDIVWLLGAIMALQGERDRALAMIEKALEERRDQLPKHWFSAELVRRRLESWRPQQ
jgi:hypothetical protein